MKVASAGTARHRDMCAGYGGRAMMAMVVVVMALCWWVRLRGKAEGLRTRPKPTGPCMDEGTEREG